ncbi:neutral protease NprB [Dactylosporangium fulvum]|uniref:Neutral metalloproteinase n=1 Tax=Dactylosporangium fulvum TaxID=53359 RepID=A0ABY5VPG5_9ACTN|nr:M4 family metallopeptidase [Dactylosporangium fulvum]UWP79014.1 M4 family metallopeptidase [Dactylosporangium fulvum]
MSHNGLQRFTLHSNDERFDATLAAADEPVTAEPEQLDPETAARRYLNQMIANPAVPELTAPEPAGGGPEFRTIGTETVPLTGTKIVKFAQYHHHIPVYGSLVTVELDGDNSLLAISSAVGEPAEVDPLATVSPAQAAAVIREDAGDTGQGEPPRLYYYFDTWGEPDRWRLVYIAKNVLREGGGESHGTHLAVPELVDYVVDAHTGTVVARLPRTQSVTWSPGEGTAADGLGLRRQFRLERDGGGNLRLLDSLRNVRTHDFKFQDARFMGALLPGDFVGNPPEPWDGAAISAHANAVEVADFLLNVLQRNGLDNMGGPFVSSVNCTYQRVDPAGREWRNAAWIGTQMIYGQRLVDGALRSYAIARDVVAHEIMHGLTDATARLEYVRESGALNESYSDIFGIIISNVATPDVDGWNWEMGEDLSLTGVPIRDLSDPTRFGQPAHLDDFRRLDRGEVPGRRNDWGWVHVNSGIHNKAAHNLLTAKDGDGVPVFTPNEVAALFYLALSQYLSRTSGFGDSRRGVELAARTLFRSAEQAVQDAKLAALGGAFDAVGIAAQP